MNNNQPNFSTHKIVDGLWVPKDQTHSQQQTTPAPATGPMRLVGNQWVLISQLPSTPVQPKPPIGFNPKGSSAVSVAISEPKSVISINGKQRYATRKEILRAIEVAAGRVLLSGQNQKALEMLRRGRLGGRKDNMDALHQLLDVYTMGA